jgi:hypothetical protein
MADVLQNVAQGLVQNELFYAVGAMFVAAAPPIAQYLQPVVRPASPPEQYQFSTDGSVTTVTQTATIFPKPSTLTHRIYDTTVKTSTAKYTATTTFTAPRFTTDVVTEKLTQCVSTSHHNHYRTVWSPYPDRCVESTTLYEPCTPTYVPETPCETVVDSSAPMPTSWFPWEWTNTAELIMFSVLLAAAYLYHPFKMKSSPEETKRKYKELEMEHKQEIDRIVAAFKTAKEKLTKERNDVLEMYQDERDMKSESDSALIKLGVIKAQGDKIDIEFVGKKVLETEQSMMDHKERTRDLTAANEDLNAKLLEATENIKRLLNRHYVEGYDLSYDEFCKEKDSNYKRLLKSFQDASNDEAINEREGLIKKLKDELDQLRKCPSEIGQLKRDLESAKQQAKNQGVQYERRWDEERKKLIKEHNET